MFPWNIAKSAEEMFSRWALKRLCKFLLKKKLGQFVLGDIDLDQLDVQLREGTIQLSDLALNVDFLNEKFSAEALVRIKEGSVGSLLVRMPWKGKQGFEIEVDELELVLSTCTENKWPAHGESFNPGNENHGPSESGKSHVDMVDNTVKFTSGNVHEGVKTIAKMVKWLLTSFHVKIKKLIIAFDPLPGDKKRNNCDDTLVLRISEIECGTCVTEDSNSNADAKVDSFLGVSHLTNFVKFQGALLELLQLEDRDKQTCVSYVPETTYDDLFLGRSPANVMMPILTGSLGGFSGNLRLSIPWKDGSLDIHRVDADVFIDHIWLKLQPSTMKWFTLNWEVYRNLDKDKMGYMHNKSAYSGTTTTDKILPACGGFPVDDSSLSWQESLNEGMLPGSHLISDWLPFSKQNEKDLGEPEELDFGASVDQFFECLDEMRSSQSAFGDGGTWNWKRSVFSAITAASSLASGSLHISSEQQHVETNLKANFAGVSVVISFNDENQKHFSDLEQPQINVGSEVHFVAAECCEIFLAMQVSPREMRLHSTIKYIEVADYLSHKNDATVCLHENTISNQTQMIQCLQADVQGALPPIVLPPNDHDTDGFNGLPPAAHFPFGITEDVVKVTLLKTSGSTCYRLNVMSNSPNGRSTVSKFSLELSPLVLWVNFSLIHELLDLLKEVEKAVARNEESNAFSSSGITIPGAFQEDVKSGSSPHVTTLSSTKSLQGDISVFNARVFLCFPFESGRETRGYASWKQFIAFDFSSPSISNKGSSQENEFTSDTRSPKKYSASMNALHLNLGNLEAFLITSTKDIVANSNENMHKQELFAENILSTNRADFLSVITMFWQTGYVTGPWIAKKAKSLILEESRNRCKFVGKGYEFASVSTVKDLENSNSETRQEVILSSNIVLHVCLSRVTINLGIAQYRCIYYLVNQLIKGFSRETSDAVDVGKGYASQTTILVDCDSLRISISPDIKKNIKFSMQREIPGSWYHLRLEVQKFELMSVSNIGGIKDAIFFWLAHGEGKLLGCITGSPDQEFLLISSSNSTMKRGDGEGSNALSSRLAGTNIIHIWDPESSHGFTSVSVRCATIVAVGGRLDWLDAISSFFSLSSPEVEQAADECIEREDPNKSSGVSFSLILVDVGLSYVPYSKNFLCNTALFGPQPSSSVVNQGLGDHYIAGLLAASSLTFSNITTTDSVNDDYRIAVQDIGFLIRNVSKPENLDGDYSVKHLHKIGYVKVAREALVEAIVRTNCRSGLLWEVEFSESHIYMETCHDTTSGMIHLAAQLQRLFAPDLEESVVHLQTRWNDVQHAQERKDFIDEMSSPQGHTSCVVQQSETGMVGLMDEICEDAFLPDKNQSFENYSAKSQSCNSPEKILPLGVSILNHETHNDLPFIESVSVPGLSGHTPFMQEGYYPEFIEGYCLSELRSLSKLSRGTQLSPDIPKFKDMRNGDQGEESNGWYGDMSLRIVDNHISEASSVKEHIKDDLSSSDHREPDDYGKPAGRVLFKNIDFSWSMYAGSDWNASAENGEQTINIRERDSSACLELTLSGIQVLYNIFPAGEMCVSKVSLSVQDFHLYDNSADAPWKLVLGYYHSKNHPRQSSSKAIKLELEAIRPDPLTPLEEYRLRIALLPILVHLHQHQLDFLISFFSEMGSSVDQSPSNLQNSDGSKSSPTMCRSLAGHTVVEEALLPYFQRFDIGAVLIRVDYSPSRVDLAALGGGKYIELVNLVPWKGVELQLKHVHSVGIYGWANVCETILGEWLEDISQNQIHKILRGLPTVRSLVAVSAGASKLVSLPVENYRKDRRLLKGMQRGAIAFLRSISLEAVGLGVHLAAGAHEILVQAEYILTSIPPSMNVQSKTTDVRSNQPKDAQEGIQKAYESLSDGIGKSASALVRTPLKKYQRGVGAGSALATAVRALPAAAIAPASACASALHYALLGFRNSLDPERKKESMEKYLGPSDSTEQN